MSEITLNITGLSIDSTDGAEQLHVVVGSGFQLPVSPEQAVPITTDIYRLAFNKQQVEELVKALTAAGDKLKDKSDLIVASDIEHAAKQAEFAEGLRNGNG